ncbi:hypothetical protein WDV91_00605 [Curtobacterium flaccumfaciens pv. flaccumfaciens]
MKKNRALGGSIAAIAFLAGSIALPAAAQASTAEEAPCSEAQLQSGECATFVAMPGAKPVVEAVRFLASEGNTDQAEAFIKASAASNSDAVIQEARDVLIDPEPVTIGSVTGGSETSSPGDFSTRSTHVSDYMWEIDDTITYGYCASTCTTVGTVKVNLWHDLLWYGDTGPGVAGSIYVTSGPGIAFDTITCKTFYEVFPFDQVLKDWQNCRDAAYSGYSKARQINWADFKQGSAVGTKYHLEFTTKWRGQTGGAFGNYWNSNSYKIDTRTSASFIH